MQPPGKGNSRPQHPALSQSQASKTRVQAPEPLSLSLRVSSESWQGGTSTLASRHDAGQVASGIREVLLLLFPGPALLKPSPQHLGSHVLKTVTLTKSFPTHTEITLGGAYNDSQDHMTTCSTAEIRGRLTFSTSLPCPSCKMWWPPLPKASGPGTASPSQWTKSSTQAVSMQSTS